jgi:hypothetical protein
LAGMVLRPMNLSCADRSFLGLTVLIGELIVGLQVVRGDIERLQFRMVAEIHGRWSGALLRTLLFYQPDLLLLVEKSSVRYQLNRGTIQISAWPEEGARTV